MQIDLAQFLISEVEKRGQLRDILSEYRVMPDNFKKIDNIEIIALLLMRFKKSSYSVSDALKEKFHQRYPAMKNFYCEIVDVMVDFKTQNTGKAFSHKSLNLNQTKESIRNIFEGFKSCEVFQELNFELVISVFNNF